MNPPKICACMGPMYGEPYCPCRMEQLGLPLNEVAREQERVRAEKQMKEFFDNGGFSGK